MFDKAPTKAPIWSPRKETPFFDNQSAGKRPLWNVNDVATFLGVSIRTVRDWVYRRVIPFRKAGKAVRFCSEEIERWTLPKE